MKNSMVRMLAVLLVAVVFAGLSVYASDSFSIPAGSTLRAQLETTLNTKMNKNGDPFVARIVEPILVKGEEVVPVGSTVEGHVSFVKEPGRAKGVAEMRLTPETLTTPDGIQYSISAGLQGEEGAEGAKVKGDEGTIQGSGKSKKGAAKDVGIGAGAGAGVGAIAGGGTGALYGVGIGAAAGMLHNVLRKHKDLTIPAGTELTFVVARATTAKKVEHPTGTPLVLQQP